ncbi:MAG TPA: ABC transporter permease [Nocardioides sp.]|nr:ABC transporter permease [Nocardioides sp.]
MTATTPERASSFSLDIEKRTISSSVGEYIGRLRSGEPGALPSVLGLIVLLIVFSQVSGQFLTSYNIGNLPSQGAYIAIIGLGLVFVLLLGEIDLSAGTTGGMAAAFAARAVFSGDLHHALPAGTYWGLIVGLLAAIGLAVWLRTYIGAVVVALGLIAVVTNLDKHVIIATYVAVAIGAAVGILNGFLVAKVGIPSFVVTLSLFLAWQGVLLFALSSEPIGTTNYGFWFGLTSTNLSPLWSWIFVIVLIAGYAGLSAYRAITARKAGLAHDGMDLVLFRGGVLAVVGIALTIFANRNRGPNQYVKIEGIPWAAAICILLMIACTFLLSKTGWGRHLYATGGNAEAARRAGIDVVKMKVTAFTLCSAFGAFGGIMLASSSHSVSLDLGAGNTLLFAVAAAVIGGTSLFGGRGRPRDAIIGALVITIIPNGLGLRPNTPAQLQQVVTGGVLLLAAAVDAISRRRAAKG